MQRVELSKVVPLEPSGTILLIFLSLQVRQSTPLFTAAIVHSVRLLGESGVDIFLLRSTSIRLIPQVGVEVSSLTVIFHDVHLRSLRWLLRAAGQLSNRCPSRLTQYCDLSPEVLLDSKKKKKVNICVVL
jgi:hypothetical protein